MKILLEVGDDRDGPWFIRRSRWPPDWLRTPPFTPRRPVC